MTREEAIEHGKEQLEIFGGEHREFIEMAIKALDQEPSGNAINRQAVLDLFNKSSEYSWEMSLLRKKIEKMPSVTPQEPKTGHCKECKYFEYDSVAKVDGIPLIVAHEICSRWGDGCKTKEDGYCFLFEPQESEEV